jgi:hypothetical protein
MQSMKIENEFKIPDAIVQEADFLSKTGISFRDILEVLYQTYLKQVQTCPEVSLISEDLKG